MSSILDKIDPTLKEKYLVLIERCNARGVEIRSTQGLRDPFEQAVLWRQSRSTAVVNAKIEEFTNNGAPFLAHCLSSVGPQHGDHATNTPPGISWHQWGEAIDSVWIVDGHAEWSTEKLVEGVNGYKVYAEEAEAMALTAGGHWTSFKDWPHVQLRAASNASSVMPIAEINDEMFRRFGEPAGEPVHTGTTSENGGIPTEIVEKAKVIAENSPVRNYFWKDRGRAPIGYIKGVAVTFAKSYYELKTNQDTAVNIMSQYLGAAHQDALSWYEISASTKFDRLRAVYTLALGLGMRESSGNTTEGRDTTVTHPTEENAEAGLFQVSYDSFHISPWMQTLFERYHSAVNSCSLSIFMEGTPDKHRDLVGSGKGAAFQKFIKECPSCATEYVMLMLRLNRTHFGPINTKKAEYNLDAERMFREIEQVVDDFGD